MKPHTPQSLAWQEGFEAALLWARDSSRASANPYLSADQPAATETAPLNTDRPYCRRCQALPQTPHAQGCQWRDAETAPSGDLTYIRTDPITGKLVSRGFEADTAAQGAPGIDPLPRPHPIVDVRIAPQGAPCGHLIRDGQTTIGACELGQGHDGEHMRKGAT